MIVCQFDADARKLGGGRMSVPTYVIALDDDADDADAQNDKKEPVWSPAGRHRATK